MNDSDTDRTRLLLLDKADTLARATVAVFGLGGVGGYAVEALSRAGIAHLILVDYDVVTVSNKNRQILALDSTVGCLKTTVATQRIHQINAQCHVTAYPLRYSDDTAQQVCLQGVDYCIDCMDDCTAKVILAKKCTSEGIPIISCLGTANRLTADFVIKDIYSTSDCPLASKMRSLLRKAQVPALSVLVNTKKPDVVRTAPLASISYVPAMAGILLAQKVIKDLLDIH